MNGKLKRTDDYGGQAAQDTASQLQVDPATGLTAGEAQARLQRYGYNEIEEKEEPLWHRVFRRFWGPIPWMIEVAAILSAVVGKWDDFVIILIMLLVNAGLDFFQEHRAPQARRLPLPLAPARLQQGLGQALQGLRAQGGPLPQGDRVQHAQEALRLSGVVRQWQEPRPRGQHRERNGVQVGRTDRVR